MNKPLSDDVAQRHLSLEPANGERLANLCGPLDQHLRMIERRVGVEILARGAEIRLTGDPGSVAVAERLIPELYELTESELLSAQVIHLHLQESGVEEMLDDSADRQDVELLRIRRGNIRARGANQSHYVRQVLSHDINFGIGPAGTGKTYLAVACAVAALERDQVRRIVLVRPAVEAGERLGFLPGDLAQKVDPYLRPLFDALREMLGFERVGKLMERDIIEVAPLAYMRGRTLNEAFVILDEAQNTSVEQMKMFLTRIGFGTTAVITGDVTQIDLPRGTRSGLVQVSKVLEKIDGLSFTYFESKDVVRHPLVAKILDAYAAQDERERDAELHNARQRAETAAAMAAAQPDVSKTP